MLALLGENGAGKSTLVKIIAGDYTPDAARSSSTRSRYPSLTPDRRARSRGRHHLPGVPGRPDADRGREHLAGTACPTVSASSTGGASTTRPKILDAARGRHRPGPTGRRRCASASARSSRSPVRCRGSARLLILDEPTAALSHHETERLFSFVRRLRDQGVAIIYITHRLDEVTTIADRVQVLRDGQRRPARQGRRYRPGRDDRGDGRPAASPRSRVRADAGPLGERAAAIRWTDAASGASFRDASASRSTPARSWRSTASSAPGAAEVGETAYGLRP